MPLWRREGFVEDKWAFLEDDAPVPAKGAIVAPLKRWLAERETLMSRADPVGVAVEAGADAQAHLADLADRPLVALAFDKFADGRSFSYARILRDRLRFGGELRAIGDVLIDEIPLMLRCGFQLLRGHQRADPARASNRTSAGLAAALPAEQRARRGARGDAAVAAGDQAFEGSGLRAKPRPTSALPLGVQSRMRSVMRP